MLSEFFHADSSNDFGLILRGFQTNGSLNKMLCLPYLNQITGVLNASVLCFLYSSNKNRYHINVFFAALIIFTMSKPSGPSQDYPVYFCTSINIIGKMT
jgi:hypothetical protein